MNLRGFITSFLTILEKARYRHIKELEGVEYCADVGYKTGHLPPAEGWSPCSSRTPLYGRDTHDWIRAHFTTPSAGSHEYLVLRITTGREQEVRDSINPQGILYLNGEMVQGFDIHHTEVYLEADTPYRLVNYFYMGSIDESVNCIMNIYAVNRQMEQLYYDVKVPYESCLLLPEESDAYVRVMSVLVQAIRMVDLRDPNSPECCVSLSAAQSYLNRELYENLCTHENKPVIYCVGHTHIDVEWLWTRAQTREKIQRSFATAKMLMDHYAEYRMMLSQPELYRYLKEEAPEKYEELRELVRQGRWEPEGAMYLEADCNLTGGESLIRQILFGKRFFKQEFGIDSRILFLPDVFGYSAALPQILKKSGIDFFVTSKISWNDTNAIPFDEFLWEGIDGSELFTAFITVQDYSAGKHERKTTYTGTLTPSQVKGTWERFHPKEYANGALMTFGWGDGGGGATKEMLEYQRRLSKGIPGMPVTKMSSLRSYLDESKAQFDRVCAQTQRIPRWVGELYLEFHRGTYTSVAKIKQQNRRAEELLGLTEVLSVTASCFGADYDSAEINRLWKLVLHNQFHDILPGSSIHAVYEQTDLDYAEIFGCGNGMVERLLTGLSERIASEGGLLVYNPLGGARTGMISVDGECRECREPIPAYGWRVIPVPSVESRVRLDGRTAENPYYILCLSPDGAIASLFDKRVGREVFRNGEKGNVFAVFEDHPVKYDAWEIEDHYKLKKWALDSDAEIEPVVDGSRAGFRVTKAYMSSTITQTVYLYSEHTRIDFETVINWQEEHQLLKAFFPLNVHSMYATYEIQFGHVVRPTHENTSWDRAKFETYAHKWVDLSENGYGVSLLNDAKYGYSTEGSTLAITLLKCATYPDPQADKGQHFFTYSLMPHIGDFREAGVIREAYALNQPLLCRRIAAHEGSLPPRFSFVSCDSENIVISAVKKAENDDSVIVRLYDSFDCRSDVTVNFPAWFTRAYLCDLMENSLQELLVENGSVHFPVKNFEIITLKINQ